MGDDLQPLFADLPPAVDKLARRAEAAVSLAEHVRAALPDVLRPHVIAANRRGAELVVIVDSAAWAARVRYATRSLQTALAPAPETAFEKLRVRVGAPIVR